jgi:methanogenic corrinoid protein MtbC1
MEYYKTLRKMIRSDQRNEAVLYALDLLKEQKLSIVELYQTVLSHVLNTIDCDKEPDECIWMEHMQSAIVRTIIDASFPYVIEESKSVKKVNKLVLVACPSEEYHEIGAKMAHDFFILTGYNAIFVGANTPTQEIVSAVKYAKPDLLALSVTDKYNIVKTKQVIKEVLKEKPDLKIGVGGLAFSSEQVREQVHFDYHLTSFDSIKGIEW